MSNDSGQVGLFRVLVLNRPNYSKRAGIFLEKER